MSKSELTNLVKEYSRAVNCLEKSKAQLGSDKDTQTFRDTLRSVLNQCTSISRRIVETIEEINEDGENDTQTDRLERDYRAFEKKYRDIRKEIDVLQRRSVVKAPTVDTHRPSRQQQMQQQQQLSGDFVQIHEDLEYLERINAGVKQIAQDAQDLQELVQDLNVLVNEQGEQLDQIEQNVTVTRDNVEKGHKEVVEAEKYQLAARKKRCLIIFILVAVLAFIVLVPVCIPAKCFTSA